MKKAPAGVTGAGAKGGSKWDLRTVTVACLPKHHEGCETMR
jgi:hypothetical protein